MTAPHIPKDETKITARRLPVSGQAVALIFLGAVSGFVASVFYAAYGPTPATRSETLIEQYKPQQLEARQLMLAQESVLPIITPHPSTGVQFVQPRDVAGSAIALTADGWLMTSARVTKDKKILVRPQTPATIENLVTDPATGLTFIKIKAENLRVQDFSATNAILPGSAVSVVLPYKVVSALVAEQSTCISDACPWEYADTLSFVPTLADGMSLRDSLDGGMVLDGAGKMFGVAVVGTGSGGATKIIPVGAFKPILNQLFEKKSVTRPAFSIRVVNVMRTPISDSARVLADQGFYVHLLPRVAGARYTLSQSDLKEGDVITKVVDRSVEFETQLFEIISAFKAGDTIPITIIRKGETQTLNIKLGTQL